MLPPDTYELPFHVKRDADTGVLTIRWNGPFPETLLFRHSAALLAEAEQAPPCYHWLLDMRGHAWPSERFEHWFSRILAPHAASRLRHSIFIACVLNPRQMETANGPTTPEAEKKTGTRE